MNGNGRASIHVLAFCCLVSAARGEAFEALPGFPLQFTRFVGGGDVEGGMAVEDVSGTGEREIVFGASDGMVHLINADGQERRDGLWPRHLPAPILGRVAVAPLDETGEMRILVGCVNGMLYCLSREGDILWSRNLEAKGYAGNPVITQFSPDAPKSVLLRNDRGAVISMAGNGFLDWSFRPPSNGKTPLSVVDPNGEGDLAVLFSDDEGGHYRVDRHGHLVLHWPPQQPVEHPRKAVMTPVDAEGSGVLGYVSTQPEKLDTARLELAPDYRDLTTNFDSQRLYVWNEKGQLVRTIPQDGKSPPVHLIQGDLVRTGRPQLIWTDTDDGIHVTDLDGGAQPAFPVSVQKLFRGIRDPHLKGSPKPVLGRPLLVDVDGDGRQDLVVPMNDRAGEGVRAGMLLGLDQSGQLLDGAPVYIGRNRATPIFADMDGDGQKDLVVAGGIGGSGPQIYAFRLKSHREIRMSVLQSRYELLTEKLEDQ